MILAAYLVAGLWVFCLGTVVGSFVNVCVYRIPWEKSLLWPGSHCPKCLQPVAARDNIPILGWLLLRGRCRRCGLPIPARYPLIELLVGLLFAAAFVADVGMSRFGLLNLEDFARLGYHLILITLLAAATFIDYDLYIIPDSITVPGMVLGLGLGAAFPWIRPEPSAAATALDGFLAGLIGWAVGGGMVWAVRILGGIAFRREAMGFGDVTLMAMIGAFLGWQAAVLTFFLAPFLGIAHAAWKVARLLGKIVTRGKVSVSDREMPYGPYLSLAALVLLVAWPWLWPGWGRRVFGMARDVAVDAPLILDHLRRVYFGG